jgi:hypothetical protein
MKRNEFGWLPNHSVRYDQNSEKRIERKRKLDGHSVMRRDGEWQSLAIECGTGFFFYKRGCFVSGVSRTEKSSFVKIMKSAYKSTLHKQPVNSDSQYHKNGYRVPGKGSTHEKGANATDQVTKCEL